MPEPKNYRTIESCSSCKHFEKNDGEYDFGGKCQLENGPEFHYSQGVHLSELNFICDEWKHFLINTKVKP